MFEGQAALESDLEALAADRFCQNAKVIARELSSKLLPPESISTRECAAQYRYLPNPEGDGKRLWDPDLTPYMNGPQDALDDPRYRFVVVPGPARTGKSIAAENFLFKRMRHGPLTDTIIYLPASSDIDSYADKEFADFFTLHPELQSKLGKRTTDNKREFKRVAGRAIQLLPANKNTVRQKQAPFIWASEVDGFTRVKPSAVKALIAIRGRAYGNQFKGYMESHADAGWFGIAGEWLLSTKGLWFWPCARCGGWSSPHPLAPKGLYMPLVWDRQDSLPMDEMLDHIVASAGLRCPHCGQLCLETDKTAMNLAGIWVFDGQVITADGAVNGEMKPNDTAGFWIHGAMSPFVRFGELAKEYVGALVLFERTKKSERLREVTAKSLGPVYEGGDGAPLSAEKLKERAGERRAAFVVGTVPSDAMFATLAIDVGHRKFDISIYGWDLESRSWLVERETLTKRRWNDGIERELRPAERIEDWAVLEPFLDRIIPFAEDQDWGLPVAAMAIDTGDGHVTEKAREFARRMSRKGKSWKGWQKVRLIKGAKLRTAPEVPVTPRKVSKDENGQPVLPVVDEWDLGVHKLKMQSIEWLRVDDHGPGHCYFADGLPASTFDEFVGEKFIDDEWVRTGPNESLDLFGYANAVRQMLKPDRAEIDWDVRRPAWARPVKIRAGTEAPVAASTQQDTQKKSIFERIDQLNEDDD